MPYDVRRHKFANNAWGLLTSAIGPGDLSINVALGVGAAWPALVPGEIFKATIFNPITGVREIVHCTAVNGITMLVERGRESTIAQAFVAGTIVQHAITAQTLEWFESQV